MTDKVLLDSGYREYPLPIGGEYANRFFQKKIKDEKGIKYYIDVFEYELQNEYNYEFILYTSTDKFYVKSLLYGFESLTIEEIESEIEKIWAKCNFNYYEMY